MIPKAPNSSTIEHFRNKSFLFLLGLGILLNLILILFIPSHPDDFSTYHAFACSQSFQNLNIYHAPCNVFWHDFGFVRYLQSYEYIGVADSILMKIAVIFIPPFVAHYVLGILAFILFIVGMQKSFQIGKNWILILFYYPITFPILHTAGSVKISIVVFSWTPFMIQKAANSSKLKKYSWYFFIALSWLLATEDKPFFIFLLPGIFFLSFSKFEMSELSFNLFLKKIRVYLLLVIPTLLFLTLSEMGGNSYLNYLAGNTKTLSMGIKRSFLSAILHCFSWFAFSIRSVDYNYNPDVNQPEYAEALPWVLGFLSFISLLTMIGVTLLMLKFFFFEGKSIYSNRRELRNSKHFFMLSSIFLLLLFPVIGGGWAGHHFVFAHVVIFTMLAKSIEKRNSLFDRNLIIIFCISTVVLTSLTPNRSYNSNDSRRAIDYATTNSNERTIINCAYSCYFEYSLRNIRNVPVTFALVPEDASSLLHSTQENFNQIMQICKDCTHESNIELFGSDSDVSKVAEFGEWSVFRILLKEDIKTAGYRSK